MPLGELFADPTDTREELMAATYAALCEHGYAELTIQRISDQFPKSKSLLYHHYDSKDELLVDFLSFILDYLETTVPQETDVDAVEQLTDLLEYLLPADPDPERVQFIRAIIELRAQAGSNPEYQAQFTRSTQYFQQRFADIIAHGAETGVFRPVDAEQVASLLVASIDGAMLQQVTTDTASAQPTIHELRAELDAYIDRRLLATESGATE